jgi:hypothetical protein
VRGTYSIAGYEEPSLSKSELQLADRRIELYAGLGSVAAMLLHIMMPWYLGNVFGGAERVHEFIAHMIAMTLNPGGILGRACLLNVITAPFCRAF